MIRLRPTTLHLAATELKDFEGRLLLKPQPTCVQGWQFGKSRSILEPSKPGILIGFQGVECGLQGAAVNGNGPDIDSNDGVSDIASTSDNNSPDKFIDETLDEAQTRSDTILEALETLQIGESTGLTGHLQPAIHGAGSVHSALPPPFSNSLRTSSLTSRSITIYDAQVQSAVQPQTPGRLPGTRLRSRIGEPRTAPVLRQGARGAHFDEQITRSPSTAHRFGTRFLPDGAENHEAEIWRGD